MVQSLLLLCITDMTCMHGLTYVLQEQYGPADSGMLALPTNPRVSYPPTMEMDQEVPSVLPAQSAPVYHNYLLMSSLKTENPRQTGTIPIVLTGLPHNHCTSNCSTQICLRSQVCSPCSKRARPVESIQVVLDIPFQQDDGQCSHA